MMYKNKLVAALKVDGKILREEGDVVHMPFGSEYAIYLKNLESRNVVIDIEIDGNEVVEEGLLLRPGVAFDLERFVKNSNRYSGNRFKFIERTKNIENHRGIGGEDGIIRISFRFEKAKKYVSPSWGTPRPDPFGYDWTTPTYFGGGLTRGHGGAFQDCSLYSGPIGMAGAVGSKGPQGDSGSFIQLGSAQSSVATKSLMRSVSSEQPVNDAGITVPGSISNQSFMNVTAGELEDEEHVIVFMIKGDVAKPVTVKTKKVCSYCGRQNAWKDKFCGECGAALEVS